MKSHFFQFSAENKQFEVNILEEFEIERFLEFQKRYFFRFSSKTRPFEVKILVAFEI